MGRDERLTPLKLSLAAFAILSVSGSLATAQISARSDSSAQEVPQAGTMANEAERLARLIDDLGAPDLSARNQAERSLLAKGGAELADVESALRTPGLTPEQRLRLESIGRELFARVPKAGLGVRFGNQRGVTEGMPLAGIVEGFPASKVLRPGDIIITINGQPVANQAHMGALILSHLPGESLDVVLDRLLMGPEAEPNGGPDPDGGNAPAGVLEPIDEIPVERIRIDVPLGKYEDLQTGIDLTPSTLELAYRQRLAKHRANGPGLNVIGASISPVQWLRTEGYDAEQSLAPDRRLRPLTAWRVVQLAGQSASELGAVELRRGDANAARSRANRSLRADGVYDQVEEALAGYRALAHRLTQIHDELTAASNLTDDAIQQRRLRSLESETADIERTLEEIRDVFNDAESGNSPTP